MVDQLQSACPARYRPGSAACRSPCSNEARPCATIAALRRIARAPIATAVGTADHGARRRSPPQPSTIAFTRQTAFGIEPAEIRRRQRRQIARAKAPSPAPASRRYGRPSQVRCACHDAAPARDKANPSPQGCGRLGHVARNLPQLGRFREGQDARKTDMAAHRRSPPRPEARPEEKQCSRKAKSPPASRSSRRMARDVGIGAARVNGQRDAGQTRRTDMGAETGPLHLMRRGLIEVVETALADADHLRMTRSSPRSSPARAPAPHARVAGGCRPSTRVPGSFSTSLPGCGGTAQGWSRWRPFQCHAGRPGARDHVREFGCP